MKKLWIALGIVACAFLLWFFGTGFMQNNCAYLQDYSVSADGQSLTVKLSVSTSVGYIRKVATHEQDGTLVLTCTSAFGGINGKIGAKSDYTVSLPDGISKVALCRASGGSETVLKKDADGQWVAVQSILSPH